MKESDEVHKLLSVSVVPHTCHIAIIKGLEMKIQRVNQDTLLRIRNVMEYYFN